MGIILILGASVVSLIVVIAVLGRKCRGLKELAPSQFPTVSADQFEQWRNAELKSNHILLWSLCALPVVFFVGVTLATSFFEGPHSESIGVVAWIAVLTALAGMIGSAIVGSRAAKLKESLGITWPMA